MAFKVSYHTFFKFCYIQLLSRFLTGDDTTFQSFPKHLQEHLSTHIPSHLDIKIRTSLYPTYKCVKPLSYAAKNFLEWLTTQPPGPVVLLGHSMGGLLAAEAATDQSNNPDRYPGAKPRRIIGVIAFDTPYLGMHPHVVVSGIASLLPKGDEDNTRNTQETTKAMNDHPQVNIVDAKVTDDWEEFKRQGNIHPGRSPHFSHNSLSQSTLTTTPQDVARPRSPSPLLDRAINLISTYSDESLARWLRKHADDPVNAGGRWIIERYQFGVAMFDPQGLMARYKRLVGWQGGKWVNYWTETVPDDRNKHAAVSGENKDQSQRSSASSWMENDSALMANGIIITPTPEVTSSETASSNPIENAETRTQEERTFEKLFKKREKESKVKSKPKSKSKRHFVVLPDGLAERLGGLDRWEQVEIAGVESEVDAHLGLFIPGNNLKYEALVGRIGKKVLDWCEDLPKIQILT